MLGCSLARELRRRWITGDDTSLSSIDSARKPLIDAMCGQRRGCGATSGRWFGGSATAAALRVGGTAWCSVRAIADPDVDDRVVAGSRDVFGPRGGEDRELADKGAVPAVCTLEH